MQSFNGQELQPFHFPFRFCIVARFWDPEPCSPDESRCGSSMIMGGSLGLSVWYVVAQRAHAHLYLCLGSLLLLFVRSDDLQIMYL